MSSLKNNYIRVFAIMILILAISYQVTLNSDRETRLMYWSNNLRCPVCQGEVIADSPASFSNDMKLVLESQIHANLTDREIKEYWVNRYGEQIIMNIYETETYLYYIPLSLSLIFAYFFKRKIIQ